MKKTLIILSTVFLISFLINIKEVKAVEEFFDFNFENFITGDLVGQGGFIGDTGYFDINTDEPYYFSKQLHFDHLTTSYKSASKTDLETVVQDEVETTTWYMKIANAGASGTIVTTVRTNSGIVLYLVYQKQGSGKFRFEDSSNNNIFGTNEITVGDWTKLTLSINDTTNVITLSAWNEGGTLLGTDTWPEYSANVDGKIKSITYDVYDAEGYIEGYSEITGLTWDDEHLQEYVDEIKDIRLLWKEPTASGWKFGLGIDIQNNFQTWNKLRFQQTDYSIDDYISLKDVLGNTLLRPSIVIDSLDYVSDWATGTYSATFTLYMDAIPELQGQTVTLEIADEDDIEYLTQSEYEEMVSYQYEITEYDYPIRGPLEQWLYSFTLKFPISWVLGVKDVWDANVIALEGAPASSDNLTVSWTLPSTLTGSATGFNNAVIPIIDMTSARSDYAPFFTVVRTTLIYIFWISAVMLVIQKSKKIINSLTQS